MEEKSGILERVVFVMATLAMGWRVVALTNWITMSSPESRRRRETRPHSQTATAVAMILRFRLMMFGKSRFRIRFGQRMLAGLPPKATLAVHKPNSERDAEVKREEPESNGL